MIDKRKKADMVVDLQYGSTGKGAICGYLATTRNYDLVVTANMPNAGHTFIDADGNKMVHKVLPNGIVGKSVRHVVIGPGAIFSMDQLDKELRQLAEFGHRAHWQLHIHENAVVLKNEHRHIEQGTMHLSDIGSTQQGTSVAMCDKIRRDHKQNPTAKATLPEPWQSSVISQAEYILLLRNSNNILLEAAQGYSLGINAGFYPFCTSRDCTPSRFLADMGVPHTMLRRVIGTLRLHPIRVGGNSGPCYPDQKEITWKSIGQEPELTTVTQRERRLFTFSEQQIREAMVMCQPDEIFINFCNYAPESVPIIKTKIWSASYWAGCHSEILYEGWGPRVGDIKETAIVRETENVG